MIDFAVIPHFFRHPGLDDMLLVARTLAAIAGLALVTNVSAGGQQPSTVSADGKSAMVQVQIRDGASVEGRVVVEAQDGGLIVEQRNGVYRTIPASDVIEKSEVSTAFNWMSAEELGQDLLHSVGPGFEVHSTEHYLICSNSAEEYAEFCGKLLERVYDQYFAFMKSAEVSVAEPDHKLPVLIFASEAEYREFAERQNPGTTFGDSPGSYSITHNQTLLMDLTRDRSVRSVAEIRRQLADQPLQVATMVHESVHQLAFNSGLQVRMADNPVWLSEGLAVYFEPIMPRSSTLWTKPGLVNGRLHPIFGTSVQSGQPKVLFDDLIRSDTVFRDTGNVASAYAESWAIVSYLFRHEKDGMQRYLTRLSQRRPMKPVAADDRLAEFRDAFGKSPGELTPEVISFVKRLRVQ